jgi:hypothetical protein
LDVRKPPGKPALEECRDAARQVARYAFAKQVSAGEIKRDAVEPHVAKKRPRLAAAVGDAR